jgi:hypothetical protein
MEVKKSGKNQFFIFNLCFHYTHNYNLIFGILLINAQNFKFVLVIFLFSLDTLHL